MGKRIVQLAGFGDLHPGLAAVQHDLILQVLNGGQEPFLLIDRKVRAATVALVKMGDLYADDLLPRRGKAQGNHGSV